MTADANNSAARIGSKIDILERDAAPKYRAYATLRDARNAIAHSNTIPNENEIEEYERQSSYLKAALVGLRDGTRARRKQEMPEPG